MNLYYRENGDIVIEAETIEDRIILKTLHGIRIGTDTNSHDNLVFEQDSPGKFVASAAKILISREKLIEFYKGGTKLEAIKYVKHQTNWGLKDSKDYIDNIWLMIAENRY